jgi:hypothetical protein
MNKPRRHWADFNPNTGIISGVPPYRPLDRFRL